MDVRYQLDVVFQDLRYAARTLRRASPLSLAVVLTLALGLGLNAVLFSLFNGLLFRPVVSHDADSFVQIYARVSGQRDREPHGPETLTTLEEFESIRATATTMAAVTASRWASFGRDDGRSLRGKFVSCNYLAVHGAMVRVGRAFDERDCSPQAAQPPVILTDRAWALHFGRDPSVIGSDVRLNNRPLTVVGIAADIAAGDPIAALVYVPLTLQPWLQGPGDYFRDAPGRHAWLALSGRLAPGRSLREARTELSLIAKSIDRLHAGRTSDMLVTNGAIIHEPETARTIPLLVAICMATASLILVMVCANVTTLLLSRAVSRRYEMAVRLSLGGGRTRLLRQLVTEGVVLGGLAGSIGLGLACVLPRPVAQMLTDFTVLDAFAPDWRVIGFTFGLACIAGCAAAVSPAREALRVNLVSSLRPVGHGDPGSVAIGLRQRLLANQVSIGLGLLIAILLIVRAQDRLLHVSLDYDPDAAMLTSIDLPRAGYNGRSARAFYDRLVPGLEALPGVRSVALSSPGPLRGVARTSFSRTAAGPMLESGVRAVTPNYFAMLNLRVLEGRLFDDLDARTPRPIMPVVVSQSLARQYFAGEAAVGRRIRFGNDDPGEIVGVVADTVSVRPPELDGPMLYQPVYAASFAGLAAVIGFSGDARSLTLAIRGEVQAIDARLSPSSETMATSIARAGERYAAVAKVVAVPAGLALLLSVIGIYGAAAFAVVQRTHEIGVRTALGARPHEVVSMFVSALGRPFIIGVGSGSALAAAGVMLLSRTNLMIDVSPADPIAYVVSVAALACAAGIATVIPAFRAARRDPWSVLRSD
jgi:putative ABC transport system permease protein